MSPYNRLQRDLGNCCWGRSLRWDHPLDRQRFPCCGVQFHKHAALAMWNISNTILLELGEGDVTSIRFSSWEAWVCCSTRTLSFPRPCRVAPFTVFRTRLTKINFFPSAIILELVQWTLMSHGNIAFLGLKMLRCGNPDYLGMLRTDFRTVYHRHSVRSHKFKKHSSAF